MIIDAGLVHQLIASQFPDWADLPIRPVEPDGQDNRTFRLGDQMLVRLPSTEAYATQVEKEHQWLPLLGPRLPLPIPTPLAKGAAGGGYPWPWSVYRWLDGQPATADRITNPIEFARSLAGFLKSLYLIDATAGPPPGQHNFYRGGSLAVYNSETLIALSALHGRIDVAAAEELWTAALNSRWLGPPVWVHGDIASDNLLIDNGQLCGVIDFGLLATGDPACDLVIAWTEFANPGREAFRAALPLDYRPWTRAQGWALWKALITVASQKSDEHAVQKSQRVITAVLADHDQIRELMKHVDAIVHQFLLQHGESRLEVISDGTQIPLPEVRASLERLMGEKGVIERSVRAGIGDDSWTTYWSA